MQNLASSDHHRADVASPEADRTAGARQAHARKRTGGTRERCLALGRVVQTEVIPRLVLRHRDFVPDAPRPLPKLDLQAVADFTDLVLGPDVAPVLDAFSALIAKGYSVDHLFLDLLAPSGALLGRLWDEDLCDFLEVTTGIARLQLVLSRFRVDGDAVPIEGNRRLLLISAPGERHTFGVRIVEQFLRKADWAVSSGLSSSPEQIAELVASEWFGVVGLTLSNEAHLDPLTTAIRTVREASRNRAVGIMVGGPVFLAHPELVERVGADASAVDAATAVLLAQRLLDYGAGTSKTAGGR